LDLPVYFAWKRDDLLAISFKTNNPSYSSYLTMYFFMVACMQVATILNNTFDLRQQALSAHSPTISEACQFSSSAPINPAINHQTTALGGPNSRHLN
jgi:hypothetical protein